MSVRIRVPALCAALLVLCLITGCGQAPTGPNEAPSSFRASGFPIVDTPLTLTAFQFELVNQDIDFQNLWFFQELEKKTNIRIDFRQVKDEEAGWITQLNLMFASGNLTDLILRGPVDVEEYGVAQQLLVPLDDYLDEYMPIYAKRLRESGLPENRASDGHIYTIGFLISQNINVNGHWFINRDWLDALGLAVPATVDELTEVLRAFKAGDPNGNGLADEIPYQATFNDQNNGLYNAFAFFGVPLNYESYLFIQPDETIQLAAFAPGFRDCLEWLHVLYSEGLIDPECISQNTNLWSAKVNRYSAGLFTYWRLTNTALRPDIADQFVCILPVAAEGYQPAVSSTFERIEVGAALTIANRHIEESLRWLDAQFETETMMVAQNGRLHDSLALGEDGRFEVAYVPPDNELYKIVPVICGQFFAPPEYYNSVYKMAPHRLEKAGYCEMYTQAGVMEYKSYHYLTDIMPRTAEQNARIVRLFTEIDKHMTDSILRFITGGVTDASWEAFLSSFEALHAGEYIAQAQACYDAYRQNGGGISGDFAGGLAP